MTHSIIPLLTACSLLLSSWFLFVPSTHAQDLVTDRVILRFERVIKKQMRRNQIPGIAAAIVEGNRTVYAKGFGFRDSQRRLPVDTATLFHIGSTHKSVTAMLMATLVDEGVLSWESSIAAIYPTLQPEDFAVDEITIRELISMSSGLIGEDEDTLYQRFINVPTPEDVFTLLSTLELAYLPGRHWEYSNLAAATAGYLGVIATSYNTHGLTAGYEQLLQERILAPIGMTSSTTLRSVAASSDNMSTSYRGRRRPRAAASEDRDNDALAPAGSLKSNILDMARYVSTQINRGIAPDGTRVVSAANLTETWKPTQVSGRSRYAMGWDVRQLRSSPHLTHEGQFDNFSALIGFFPEQQVGYVILVNTENVGRLFKKSPRVLRRMLGR